MNYEELKVGKFSFVYLSQEGCNVCSITKPYFEQMSKKFTESTFTHIDLNIYEDAKGYFSVFTIPAILVFSEGKELLREARFFNFEEIEEKLNRYYQMIFSE